MSLEEFDWSPKKCNVRDGNEQNGNRKKPNNHRCGIGNCEICVVIGKILLLRFVDSF